MTEKNIHNELERRVLVIDGAMGTLIQSYRLGEKEYRGKLFRSHPRPLQGNNDLLSLTQPQIIRKIHREYLDAGADIIETNTFNANGISMADYGVEDYVYEMNRASAVLAVNVAEEYTRRDPSHPRFVAGSIGPTNKTASLSPHVEHPGMRAITFDRLADAYAEQIRGLMDGGADILLVETVFDTLNAKAALFAIREVFNEKNREIPVMVSVTVVDASGRTLSGQTLEAFITSVSHFNLFSIGINCSLGAREMRPFVEQVAAHAHLPVSAYPNAGLPNQFGLYDETPEETAAHINTLLESKMVNIVGGCCGTTPDHIRRIAGLAREAQARPLPQPRRHLRLSGLEPLSVFPGSNFINIGERTNVAGSRKFAELIREKRYEEALTIARQQIENGAQVIDVNMDDALLDAEKAMTEFLNMMASDPFIARVPVMIDSSKWTVIEAGLKCLQGKGIVNSISLKEGEEIFLERAAKIRNYGAALVVMAFDEEGQASSFERKKEICRRAYTLLTEKLKFPPEDIIFDPNILTIGTGIEEHNNYAVDFIRSVTWIKENLPLARVSGGVSNLSFAFRGNNVIREAIHSAFLFHAIRAGLDMAIVNAGALPVYDQIDGELLSRVEDLIFNRRPDATERLVEYARSVGQVKRTESETPGWRSTPLPERIIHSLVTGVADYVEKDMEEALKIYDTALEIIEGPMMEGMDRVGDLFASGKLFLPQVIKSARVMKKAVAFLQPFIEKEKEQGRTPSNAGTIVLATVRGDVHDIGKNIVGIVLGCNHYKVIDLGVMTPAEKIIETAKKEKADIVGLSGLITPSLEEMVHVARGMRREGLTIPLLIGGATTSIMHTAVKIQPEYPHGVVHVKDASRSVTVTSQLLSGKNREAFLGETNRKYEELREMHAGLSRKYIPIAEARANKLPFDWDKYDPPVPAITGTRVFNDYDLAELDRYIDWTFFFHVWELKGRFPGILSHPEKGDQARRLYNDARKCLDRMIREKGVRAHAVISILPANATGDDIIIYNDEARDKVRLVLNHLRQQTEKTPSGYHQCLSDFIAPVESGKRDYLGILAATAGIGLEEYLERFEKEHDDYSVIMIKALTDRLAEALTERLHERIRKEFWGYAPEENLSPEELFQVKYRGVRPAYGYPACPDHSEKKKLFDVFDIEKHTGIRLTDRYSMLPAASVCCLVFSHPLSSYIEVGKISADQVKDYTGRKNEPLAVTERWLNHILNYK